MKRKTGELFFTVLALALVLGSCPSPNSEIPQDILFVPPETPSLVPGDCKIEVLFTAVANATKYELWYGITPNISAATRWPQDIVTETKLVSASITGLLNGLTYYVWARAWFSNNVSEFSGYATAEPLPPPGVPQSLTLSSDDTILNLHWTEVDRAEAYMVYYSTVSGNKPDAKASRFEVTGLDALIFELKNGTTYTVWLTAKNTAGESDFSPPYSATPTAATSVPGAPGQPTLAFGDTRLSVSWPAVRWAKFYTLYYSETLETNPVENAKKSGPISLAAGTVRAVITGLENEKGYYVWVQANNDHGGSSLSLSAYEVTHGKQPINLADPYFKVGTSAARFPNEEGGKGDRLSRKQETALGDLVADSMAWWGEATYGGTIDFAFVNGGVITNALPKGDILVGGIQSILWYDPMSIVTLKGSEVTKLFEYVASIRHNGGGGSGTGAFGQVSKEVRYTINYTYGDPTIGNLEGLTIHGVAVDPNKDYRFITSTYLVDGGDGYGAYLRSDLRKDSGIFIYRAVAEYIYDHDNVPIEPLTDGRITLIGAVWAGAN
jgi:hypothetical protein